MPNGDFFSLRHGLNLLIHVYVYELRLQSLSVGLSCIVHLAAASNKI
jgi:hypothetical protein